MNQSLKRDLVQFLIDRGIPPWKAQTIAAQAEKTIGRTAKEKAILDEYQTRGRGHHVREG